MKKIGYDYPKEARKTALHEAEEWYQNFLASKLNRPYEPIKRSNFGEYAMAINFLTSVMEEAKAINRVAVFNIDHMSQLLIEGQSATELLDRVLPISVEKMVIGQCKYTLLLSPQGTVLDDLIMMKLSENSYILVINAGHDITDKVSGEGGEVELTADADYLASYLNEGEDVSISDISDRFAKVDIQGPFSYKLITQLYGEEILRNRNNPAKNMGFFTFNEFSLEGLTGYISRTGYTNRWGWEMYIPTKLADKEFRRIAELAFSLGGLVVGLGGRDENRISAGNFGLPLNGHEYDRDHTPTNAPLFGAAIEMAKDSFIGKEGLVRDLDNRVDKRMVLFITEGIVTDRGIYSEGIRLGGVTSSINSPNIPLEKRLFLGSARKSVNEENGIAAIGLGWLYHNPFAVDSEGNDILEEDGTPVRIAVEFYREDTERKPIGKAIKGYISADGVTPATASKALKNIEKL